MTKTLKSAAAQPMVGHRCMLLAPANDAGGELRTGTRARHRSPQIGPSGISGASGLKVHSP